MSKRDADAVPELEPFTVGQLVVSSIEAFFSAATLHLGEALPDGRRLPATDPMEAWRALLAASALLSQLGPLMAPEKLMPYQAGLDYLLNQLATQHPTMAFPVPSWLTGLLQRQSEAPIGDLAEAIRRGNAAAEGLPAPVPAPKAPGLPTSGLPGTGLPKRSTGSLFKG